MVAEPLAVRAARHRLQNLAVGVLDVLQAAHTRSNSAAQSSQKSASFAFAWPQAGQSKLVSGVSGMLCVPPCRHKTLPLATILQIPVTLDA